MKAILKPLRQGWRVVRQRLYLQNEFVPRAIRPGDIFLVSFPKSGNTWVRFWLANLLRPEQIEVNFRTINALVPPVTALPNLKHPLPDPRFIKSHAPFQPQYPRIVYILRDGRDAMLSYYYYQRNKLPAGTTLADFLAQTPWPCHWANHVASWLDANLPADKFLLLRYEEMKQDPAGQLQRLIQFSQLNVTPERFQQALKQSSFQAMRQAEQKYGGPGGHNPEGGFMRQGKNGGWREQFGPTEKEIAKKEMNQMLIRLRYEQKGDW